MKLANKAAWQKAFLRQEGRSALNNFARVQPVQQIVLVPTIADPDGINCADLEVLFKMLT